MADKPEIKVTLKDVLAEIDARIAHIEDATLDNRDVLVKLVKQSNQIVKFLQQIEIEEVYDDDDISFSPTKLTTSITTDDDIKRKEKMVSIKELIDEFMDKHEELKEFEKELKKVKSLLTPGQIGEA